jgi:V/A-type H+-transporting ATPase subunit I
MIVRMSKVEIAGPRGLLDEVLGNLQETGVFQIEPDKVGFIEHGEETHVRSLLLESEGVGERVYLEDLKGRIDEIFSYLPEVSARESYIEPRPIIETVAETAKRHAETCRELFQRREALGKELEGFDYYGKFFETLEGLFGGVEETPNLDFIGVTIKYPEAVEPLRETLARLTGGRFELQTETAADGTVVGLIGVEDRLSDKVREALGEERIPEFSFDPAFDSLLFPEKAAYIKEKAAGLSAEMEAVSSELRRFATRWAPIYRRVRDWVEERLLMLGASASAFQTSMCFFVYGWMPSGELEPLRERLEERFAGEVAIDEKEIREEDLEKIPVVLRNPLYFRPFELFTRLLPLPRYTSYDPTPFIGIFFPVFFGMILGDAGYGLVLAALALIVLRKYKTRKNLVDAAKIAGVAAAYSALFGVLYGECFGELGSRVMAVFPVCIDRRSAVLPMLYFAVSVGVFHITLGIFLGFLSSLRKGKKRETMYRLLSIALILCVTVLVVSFFDVFPSVIAKPVVLAILVLAPFLLFTGGMLAPLELLKSIGNIVSYARIMAIGLTSVLLAFVANRLGGLSGDIALGILIGGLLHALNLALGIFSPTIHAIRLHYVEFFGKFIEHGGRRFEPLKKKP